MHSRFRRFLLVFMMLALPVQTFASVAVLGCEYLSKRSTAPAPTEMAPIAAHHATAHHHAAPALISAYQAPVDLPAAVDPNAHQCNHCAACCLAVGCPIPSVQTSRVITIPHTPHPQQIAVFNGFIPEGPERPPRSPRH